MPETQTLPIASKPQAPARRYLDGRHLRTSVEQTDEFRTERELGTTREVALAQTAALLGEQLKQSEDVEQQKIAHLYTVMSKLPDLIHGTEGMRHHNEVKRLPRDEHRANKARAVAFNHAIRDLLNHDPTISLKELSLAVADMHRTANKERWTRVDGSTNESGLTTENQWFRRQVEMILRGMQHEIFAKTIIHSLEPEFSVDDNISIEDDLHGADLYVSYRGVRFPVDIKASTQNTSYKRRQSRMPQHIIWSGIESKQVGDRFRLTAAEIHQAQEHMRSELLLAYEEYTNKHARLGRTVMGAINLETSKTIPAPVEPTPPQRETSKPEKRRPITRPFESLKPEIIAFLPSLMVGFESLQSYNALKTSDNRDRAVADVMKTYSDLSRLLSQLDDKIPPPQIRQFIVAQQLKLVDGKLPNHAELNDFVDRLVRQYQLLGYVQSGKDPNAKVSNSPDHDILYKGKSLNIQSGLRSYFTNKNVPSYVPTTQRSTMRSVLRYWR